MNSTSPDFFHFLTENRPEKWAGIVVLTVVIVLGIPMLYGVIWYERFGNDVKRTLINRFVSLNCWIGIAYLVYKVSDIYRFIVGPMPSWYCDFHVTMYATFIRMSLLCLDASVLTRYAFIFWLKNPWAFRDDFWSTFVGIWIVGFSFLSLFAWHFVARFNVIGYYFCTGQDFTFAKDSFPRDLGIIEKLTAALHLLIYLRIKLYKRQQPEMDASNNALTKASIFTFFFNMCKMGLIFTLIMVIKQIENTPILLLSQYPHYLLFYYLNFAFPSMFVILILVSFYSRAHLRKTLKDELLLLL